MIQAVLIEYERYIEDQDAMKLFKLEYRVDFPRTSEQILEDVRMALAQEAELQGWSSGYTFFECQQPRQSPAGGIVYTYEVEGQYTDDGNDPLKSSDRKGATGVVDPSENSAAKSVDAQAGLN